MSNFLESELILPDDYPVFFGYVYIADGRVIRASEDGTVATLKRLLNANEIRRCEIFNEKRQFMKIGDRV